MPNVTSQWEFGELFAPPALRRVLTVSQLTTTVRSLLEQHVGRVWVTGEISNLRVQSSGHAYFSLKDANAQLNCVLFRAEARTVNRDLLRDGLKVSLNGDLTVYDARGQYQLVVTAVEFEGIGALQIAFEKLKQKLLTEGLFAKERKRPLPRFPFHLGLVTSPTGAAIRDVLHTLERRFAGLTVTLASCRVQGQGAGAEVACAIDLLNEWSGAGTEPVRPVDVILVTRGGGSLEDLWAFNEEVVALAIAASRIPVVSAVGHEIDFTISDFVADVRAATPTAAAEILTEGFLSVREFVSQSVPGMADQARVQLRSKRQELTALVQRLQRQHPRRWLQEQAQRVDDLQASLLRGARLGYRDQARHAQVLAERLLRVKPSQWLARRRELLDHLVTGLQESAPRRFRELQDQLLRADAKLRLLSPRNVLERGYSITLDAQSGMVIRAAAEVHSGQRIKTLLRQGEIKTVVEPPSE